MKNCGVVCRNKKRVITFVTVTIFLFLSLLSPAHVLAHQHECLYSIHFIFDVYEVISYDLYFDTHLLRMRHRYNDNVCMYEKQLSDFDVNEITSRLNADELMKTPCCENAFFSPSHVEVVIQSENELYNFTHTLQSTEDCNCLVCYLLSLYPIYNILSS